MSLVRLEYKYHLIAGDIGVKRCSSIQIVDYFVIYSEVNSFKIRFYSLAQ